MKIQDYERNPFEAFGAAEDHAPLDGANLNARDEDFALEEPREEPETGVSNMNFDDDERDPFEAFGEEEDHSSFGAIEAIDEPFDEPPAGEHARPRAANAGFSWAGLAGGLAALAWIAGGVGLALSHYGAAAIMTMDPAMQAGLAALAIGPALLFWLTASAAGEALKARRLAAALTRMSQADLSPIARGQEQAQRLTRTVKAEIESLNEAVAAALGRMAELEGAAQRNAALFDGAVHASRENTETASNTLARERDALAVVNADLRNQTEIAANSIGRQVRLMREASHLVKTEITAAEDALDGQLAAFAASATVMGERTAAFQSVADGAAATTASLNTTMSTMLDGLGEATRLTDAARKSAEEAVVAATETAAAVRETTRHAVHEAKRAAQFIRAETTALQDSAVDTLAKLQAAAEAARQASQESQAAAERHGATIEKRLGALAAAAGAVKAAPAAQPAAQTPAAPRRASAARPITRETATRETAKRETAKRETVVREAPAAEAARAPRKAANAEKAAVSNLHAAASAALARGGAREPAPSEAGPRRAFKGFGGWGNFLPGARAQETQPAANDDDADLIDFPVAPANRDAALKNEVFDLVAVAGVDLENTLPARDLDRIARSSHEGAATRRRAVLDLAPTAVGRIARHVRRHASAEDVARQFRARPDLAKSEHKGESGDLVRAYLLIDAALA